MKLLGFTLAVALFSAHLLAAQDQRALTVVEKATDNWAKLRDGP